MFKYVIEEINERLERFDGFNEASGQVGAWRFKLDMNYKGEREFIFTRVEAKEGTEDDLPFVGPCD